MSDLWAGPQQLTGDAGMSAHTGPSAGKRHLLAVRVGVTVVLACGLAAGSYGIASATSSSGATALGNHVLATVSTPSKSTPVPHVNGSRLSGPSWPLPGFGQFAFAESGTVSSFTATTISVVTEFGQTLTVTTDASTIYREGTRTVARSALASGQEVSFRSVFVPVARPGAENALTTSSSSRTVGLVEILLPNVSGKVVSVNGSQVVVAQQDGLYVTVNTSTSTTYEQAGQAIPAVQLQAGTVVSVTGTVSSDHTEINATTVEIVLPSVSGRVTSVSGTTITLSTLNSAAETVTTGSSTVFRDQAGKTTISSVAKGDFVEAWGALGAVNSLAAAVVMVGPSTSLGPIVPGRPVLPGAGPVPGRFATSPPLDPSPAAAWGEAGALNQRTTPTAATAF